MITTQQGCLAQLTDMGISHQTHDHPAVFTVEQGADIKSRLPGGHTKNLFLKSKDGQYVLVCALGGTAIEVNQLHKQIGTKRLSFGKPEDMTRLLGVTPGSVTLFGLMNDAGGKVRLVIDAALAACEIVNFHPLQNTATTAISSADMMHFARSTGHDPLVIDFSATPSP
ncbi:prolyl-tRNA synthetase associated domain-containing protein [Robiginitomaculum antarcticum]|uniref:prolyl-tRNA synthetase associated domain-containing protein n=1 Tax=Robiginitomaculum antarcticum TaxID=437507 RepID=UPI00035E5EC4|nr:prolyl-tRNA synthetase associated domain-containing protein [Robiginitomaculum antarcticum]